MGIPEITYALSQVNAVAGGLANYKKEVDDGESKTVAGLNSFGLMTGNIFRNEWAKDMADHGNYLGWAVNGATDYSSKEGLQQGLMGLTFANLPSLFSGCCHNRGWYPPMMGGYCGMGMGMGMGMFPNPFMMTAPPMHMQTNIYSHSYFMA